MTVNSTCCFHFSCSTPPPPTPHHHPLTVTPPARLPVWVLRVPHIFLEDSCWTPISLKDPTVTVAGTMAKKFPWKDIKQTVLEGTVNVTNVCWTWNENMSRPKSDMKSNIVSRNNRKSIVNVIISYCWTIYSEVAIVIYRIFRVLVLIL